ncbi:MAG TPA: T9SS type A sorting domain-containing protein [Bacteroidales bacterium]|nr:T9SS type A sorting domain-containing protein [Bacteroidales bacterium]
MKPIILFSVLLLLSFPVKTQTLSPYKTANESNDNPDSTISRVQKQNTWMPSSKLVFSYDENGRKTETMQFYWDTVAISWQQMIHTYHSYDANGNMTSEFRFALNPATDKWDTVSNYTRLYINNAIYSWVYDSWDPANHEWYHAMKGEYDYNESGDEITYITFNWNAQASAWDSSYLCRMKMNSSGKDSTGEYFKWNTSGSNWESWYTYDYYYDENGNDTLIAYHNYGETEFIDHSEFDENGFRTSLTTYKWIDGDWQEVARTEYIPGTNGKTVLSTWFSWDTSLDKWVPVFQDQNYYEGESTKNNNVVNSGLIVFPNPASECIQIKLTDSTTPAIFELYDLNGKRMLQQLVTSGYSIPVSYLSHGLYLYQLHMGNDVFSGKIVIR